MENKSMEILTEEEVMVVNGGCGGGCRSIRTFWNGGHDNAVVNDLQDISDAMNEAGSEAVAVMAGVTETIGYRPVD